MGCFRCVTLEVDNLATNNYLVILLEQIAFCILLVTEVENTVGCEDGVEAFINHCERGVTILGTKLLGDFLYLTLDVDFVG